MFSKQGVWVTAWYFFGLWLTVTLAILFADGVLAWKEESDSKNLSPAADLVRAESICAGYGIGLRGAPH